MKKVLLTSAIMLACGGASASGYYYYGWYSPNTVTAGGHASSSAYTSGSTKTHGNEQATAASGAYNVSSAGATADFSKTTSSSDTWTYGHDITDVDTKISGWSNDYGNGSTNHETLDYNYDVVTEDNTSYNFGNHMSYIGTNDFYSHTGFNAGSWTSGLSKSIDVTTRASTVGGSFGATTGYNADTYSSYGGSAGSYGAFNLKVSAPSGYGGSCGYGC